jgi:hypothetical protein
MLKKQKIRVRGQSVLVVVVVMFLVLITPLKPLLVGAIELAIVDKQIAFDWLRTTAVEETIADFYRSLGWPC